MKPADERPLEEMLVSKMQQLAQDISQLVAVIKISPQRQKWEPLPAKAIPQERISERIAEQIVGVPEPEETEETPSASPLVLASVEPAENPEPRLAGCDETSMPPCNSRSLPTSAEEPWPTLERVPLKDRLEEDPTSTLTRERPDYPSSTLRRGPVGSIEPGSTEEIPSPSPLVLASVEPAEKPEPPPQGVPPKSQPEEDPTSTLRRGPTAPGPGSTEETPSASPLVLAREVPAEKLEDPPLQDSGLRERRDEGDDEASVSPRNPLPPPSAAEKPWFTLKRDGQSTRDHCPARKMIEVCTEGVKPFPRPQPQVHQSCMDIVTVTLTKPMGMTLGARPCGTGAFVSKLVEGSAAQSGQVHVGDVILGVAGRNVLSYSLQDVVEAIRAMPQGATLKLVRAT